MTHTDALQRAQRIEEILRMSPVMPVVTLHDATAAVDLARALVRGGIRVIEVTLRTPAALRAIEAIASGVPEIRVGAGTVLSVADLHAAASSGAAFAISPGATSTLLAAAPSGPIPYLPAVATASEVMAGCAAGYRHFKFFPAAAAGGVPMLQAFAGPFPEARFCPTGGISRNTAGSYLQLPNVLCVGGSWLTPSDAVLSRDWRRIEALAAEAAALSAAPPS
jgi:2-dehydro-3-deoxyphosphogluconate aldolase/(4S)-4-hydroxy-2-oxoglutarate aldolase